MKQDLRSWIEDVRTVYPDQYYEADRPLNPRFEISALVDAFEKTETRPIIYVGHPVGSTFPLVTNLMANRSRLALGMGVDPAEFLRAFAERSRGRIAPIVFEDAPFKENVLVEDQIDLRTLPIVTHFEQDGGPYITAGFVVGRDPSAGVHTGGMHRMMLKGARTCGISLHSRRRMWEYFRRSEELGRDLPVSVCIGLHPVICLSGQLFPPSEVDKYDVTGSLFGEPAELSPAVGHDMLLPRWAEIVIEGRILAKVREPEGPLGEFTGYASGRGTENVFVADRLCLRRDAIYHSINAGLHYDHNTPGQVAREAEFTNALRKVVPNVKAVHVPIPSGVGAFHVYVSIRKTIEGQAKQAIMAVFATDHYPKLVVVVDEDVDVYDDKQVLWAIATRFQASRDLLVIPDTPGTLLDPSTKVAPGSQQPLSDKLGIDATKPLGGYPSTLSIPDAAKNQAADLVQNWLATVHSAIPVGRSDRTA